MYVPDYNKLRDEAGFSWRVDASYYSLLVFSDITMKQLYKDPNAMIELFRKGRGPLKEMFGDDVSSPRLATPAISYGHINTLGAELLLPDNDDNGEVNHSKPCKTLEDGVKLLKSKKGIDFSTAGMSPFYLDYRNKVSKAFDGEKCFFWYKAEGPVTTAYTLRDSAVFYDPYDNPGLFKEFLELIVESIIEFQRFHRNLEGLPLSDEDGAGMCDDLAAMFSPDMWPEFILPCYEQYYNGLTTGKRVAHIEDLRPEHLPYLEKMSLFEYEPSCSPKVNPEVISRMCRVPFHWRLPDFNFALLSPELVRDWVFKAAADGASKVFIHLNKTILHETNLDKVRVFIEAGKEVKRMLDEGATRRDVGICVSDEGKKKFWAHWPE